MDLESLREQFPVLRRVAYLNAGTCGPVPAQAVEATVDDASPGGRGGPHDRLLPAPPGAGRRAARRLRRAPADARPGTSRSPPPRPTAIAAAFAGLALGPGDEIVTSDSEHPGVNGPLQAARDLRGVDVRAVALADVADAVGPRTRLVACSHVSWVTGETAPAALADVDVPSCSTAPRGWARCPSTSAPWGATSTRDRDRSGCADRRAPECSTSPPPSATGWRRPAAGT